MLVRAKDVIYKSNNILILTRTNPDFDSIGSSLALYLAFTDMGKKVTIVCPDPIRVELSNFIGVNKITEKLSSRNFVISLDYQEGSIEKVSYNIENNKFNLVIEPRPGFEIYSKDKVQFSEAIPTADLVVTVDVKNFDDIRSIYEANKDFFADNRTILNIDKHPENTGYGHINLINPQSATTAEIIAQLITFLGIRFNSDISTNLINSIYNETENFTSLKVTSSTFELVSSFLKFGGVRFKKEFEKKIEKDTGISGFKPQKPFQDQDLNNPPSDWLKPKIFKSSNIP